MTKPLLLACILLGAAASLHAQTQPTEPDTTVPAHPATVEQIHQYYTLTHSIDTARKIMDQTVVAMQATSPEYLPQDFWDDMRKSLAALDLEAAFTPAFQKYFSEEDMRGILDFYRSPSGQRLLAAQPQIASYMQAQLRTVGQKIGQEVYVRHKDEIDAARNKYEESQHPNTQPGIAPGQTPAPQKP